MHKKTIFILLIVITRLFPMEEQIINNITAEYSHIRNQLNSFKIDTITVFCFSMDGTEVTAYRNKENNLRLLTLWFDGEFGKNYEEYYFKNDSLIFSFIQFYEYNVLDDAADSTNNEKQSESLEINTNASNEDLLYFKNNKLVRWLKNKEYSVDSGTREFYSLERSLLKNLQMIILEINKKRPGL